MATQWTKPPLKILATQEALESIKSDRGDKAKITVRSVLRTAAGDYRLGAPYSGHSDDTLLWVYVHLQHGIVLIYTASEGAGSCALPIMTDELYEELLPGCEEVGWS
jgi:hypothetical protein